MKAYLGGEWSRVRHEVAKNHQNFYLYVYFHFYISEGMDQKGKGKCERKSKKARENEAEYSTAIVGIVIVKHSLFVFGRISPFGSTQGRPLRSR